MAKISSGESFDLILTNLRYAFWYFFVMLIDVFVFIATFLYFADSNAKAIMTASLNYTGTNFAHWFLSGFLKKYPQNYLNWQEIYRNHFWDLLRTPAFYYAFAISAAIVVIVYLIVKLFAKGKGKDKVLRGTVIRNIKTVKNVRKDLKMKPKDELGHIAIFGTTGAGKTQTILNLAYPVVTENKHKSLISLFYKKNNIVKNVFLDIKGDFTPLFYDEKKDFLINPLDVRSARWEFVREIKKDTDAGILAESFINPNNNNTNNTKGDYFIENAHFLFSVILQTLRDLDITDTAQIKKIIMNEIFYKTPEDSNYKPIITPVLKKINAGSGVSLGDTMSTLRLKLDFIRNLGFEPKENPIFSVSDWIASEKSSNIFITTPADEVSIMEGFNAAFLGILLSRLMALPNSPDKIKYRIWIDELANVARIPELAKAMSFLRSRGGSIVISFQSFKGLKRNYTDDEIADIINNANNLFCFRTKDQTVAETISKMIGERQVEVVSKSNFSTPKMTQRDGISISTHRQMEGIILPSEIITLNDLEFFANIKEKWHKSKLKFKKYKQNNIAFYEENEDILLRTQQQNKQKQQENDSNLKIEQKEIEKEKKTQEIKQEKQQQEEDAITIANQFME